MSGFRLFLDDERKTPDSFNVRTFTFEQTILFLKTRKVEAMSLDHDLGTDPGDGKILKTGYDVLEWLEAVVYADRTFPIPTIWVHSANPVGRQRMELTIDSINRSRK